MLLAWAALWVPCEVRGQPLRPSWGLHRFMGRHCFGGCRAPSPRTLWCVRWRHLWHRLAGAEPAGCAAITVRADHYWLHNLCVRTAGRSRGLGLQLHRQRLAVCREHGRHRIARLDIKEGNAAALALIRKLPQYRPLRRVGGRVVFECTW